MTAQEFLNHCWAGLQLVGYENGEYQWIGKDKNWTAFEWLQDGVYDNEDDMGKAKVAEYLKH